MIFLGIGTFHRISCFIIFLLFFYFKDYSTRIISIAKEILLGSTIALDCWHGLKYLHNDCIAISTGTKASKNQKWYEELCDKPGLFNFDFIG